MCGIVGQAGADDTRGKQVCLVPTTPLPEETPEQWLAVWMALYSDVPAGEDPEWDNTVKTILEKAKTGNSPGSIK